MHFYYKKKIYGYDIMISVLAFTFSVACTHGNKSSIRLSNHHHLNAASNLLKNKKKNKQCLLKIGILY